MPQHITVVDYDPDWPRQFQAEAARIRAVLGGNCTAIYHIGSTAVPGLAAKPILDIMPVVENLEAVSFGSASYPLSGGQTGEVEQDWEALLLLAAGCSSSTNPSSSNPARTSMPVFMWV